MKKTALHRYFASLLGALAASLLFTGALHAATITVADGVVDVAPEALCSLREALHNALADAQVDNADCPAGDSTTDTIVLGSGEIYEITDADATNPDNGLPLIDSGVRIEGNDSIIRRDPALPCVLDRTHTSDEFRIFELMGDDAFLELEDLTLANGCADGTGAVNDGGAIRQNGGELRLERVVVEDNAAWDKSGGIDIGPGGTLLPITSITDSTFRRNHGGGGAGAIGNGGGEVTILRSTFVGNTSGGAGGGALGNFGTMVIRNSTISGNMSTGTGGGGIGSQGLIEIDASTITDNSVTGPLGGGGVANAGTMTIKSSIIAGNGAGGDCLDIGSLLAEGENFDSDGSCVAIDDHFTQVEVTQLALRPLSDNGGFTQTHGLGFGSVAIDAALDCTAITGLPLEEDQRAVSRPQDGDGDGDARCDVGAFERGEALIVDGTCTLGDAIEAANLDQTTVGGCFDSASGPNTIVLDIDTTLTAADTVRSTLVAGAFAGLPDITSVITLRAGQANRIERSSALTCDAPDGPDEFRLLQTGPLGELSLEGITLAGGCADRGGAVHASRRLTIEDSTFSSNTAISAGSAAGGAIIAGEIAASISGCRFIDNRVEAVDDGQGGAVFVELGTLEVYDSVFQGNTASSAEGDAEGGALHVEQLVSLREVVFESNLVRGDGSAVTASGGALYADQVLELRDVLFSNNAAEGGDGDEGGNGRGGAATITSQASMADVSLVGNRAEGGSAQTGTGGLGFGGGLQLFGTGDLTGLTASGNQAIGGSSVSGGGGNARGGGVLASGTYLLQLSTLSENEAVAGIGAGEEGAAFGSEGSAFGGGLFAFDPVEVLSSLLEGNLTRVGAVEVASDCSWSTDPVISLGFNVVGATSSCDFTATGDQIGTAASLLPLGEHGCLTPLPNGQCLPTYPVEIGSAAADAGSCTASGVTADVRGFSRPFDDTDVANADDGCDAGAYESRDEDEAIGDGVEDGVDNCPADLNPDQTDSDGDGFGDVCDLCQGDDQTGDVDGDGVCADLDCDDTNPSIGAECPLFADGFESGDFSAWSVSIP